MSDLTATIQRVLDLDRKATGGPWETDGYYDLYIYAVPKGNGKTIADRNAELRAHAAAIAERDARISELRKEIEGIETENASYQDQVLRAYQKIKSDEAMVARAKKAMAIALTVLDDDPKPKADA